MANTSIADGLPPGLPAAAAAAVRRARRADRDLRVSHAARDAAVALADRLTAGPGLGVVVASERGDQAALAARVGEFGARMAAGERAAIELFRAIAYFPVGRVLKTVADAVGALGPAAAVPGGAGPARALAETWLLAGRARQVVVVAAELEAGEPVATAEVLGGSSSRMPETVPLAVDAVAEAVPRPGETCAELAARAVRLVPEPAPGRRTALVVGSLLGATGEALFARLAPREAGPSLEARMRAVGAQLGYDEVTVVTGCSGAATIGVALAQDLVALGRADAAVVCGADLVEGAMAEALRLLRCGDLPHMRGGAIAVALAPSDSVAAERAVVGRCTLGGPIVPGRLDADVDVAPFAPPGVHVPARVTLSGLTAVDLTCARRVAERLWPSVDIAPVDPLRSVSADVLHHLASAPAGTRSAIVGVHALGGSGICELAPATFD